MYFVRFEVQTQVSGFKFQVSSDSDLTHLPAWKGSTERSDGSLGHSIGTKQKYNLLSTRNPLTVKLKE